MTPTLGEAARDREMHKMLDAVSDAHAHALDDGRRFCARDFVGALSGLGYRIVPAEPPLAAYKAAADLLSDDRYVGIGMAVVAWSEILEHIDKASDGA